MKKLTRRTLAVVIGLVLGWCAAGYLPATASKADTNHAAPAPAVDSHTDHVPTAQPASHQTPTEQHPAAHDLEVDKLGHAVQEQPTEAHRQHPQVHEDTGVIAAQGLVPRGQTDQPQTAWYRPALWAIAGLFAAAILIGVPLLKLKGPEAAEPSHDDKHDSHSGGGHDSHASGGHH